MSSVFLKPAEFYQRKINPIEQYLNQNSFYLNKMTGRDVSECRNFIMTSIKNKKFPRVNDPIVDYFERDEHGDRGQEQCKLSQYISSVVKNDEILAPTFTTYVSTKVKKSLLVNFIDNNVKIRSVAKKEAQRAEAEGNHVVYQIKNNEQDNRKRYNNSMSGAFAANGTVISNPTAHSTLTSITRICSSLGNASNEKIIAGNRHYRNAQVTLDNLIYITSNLNKQELEEVILKYSLKFPTIEETLDCIRYSTDFYWKDVRAFQTVEDFVCKLDPVERAGFVYCGDLYHLRKYNEEFVLKFLTKLSTKITNNNSISIEECLTIMKKTDEQVVNFAHQICISEMKGKGKKYEKLDPEHLKTLASTCLNVVATIEEYRDFISAIFLTENVPSSVAYLPNMVRRSVVLSDTDSTMFSTDEWVAWRFGSIEFSDEAYAFSGSVMFIATQCIAHNLALFSANINVERQKLFMLAMKPEFVFPVFCQTPVAKHYFTTMLVKEGNVYPEPKMEIKGVHLKNSAAPKQLVKAINKHMEEIIQTIVSGKKISILDEIQRVSNIELRLRESLLNGDTEYFKLNNLKSHEAYSKGPTESPFQHHTLWQNVFAPDYGNVENPPYTVIKIPTKLDTPTALKKWLETIVNEPLRERMKQWLTDHRKRTLPTMYVSTQFVKAFGIPAEIKSIIDIEKILFDLTIADRMVLETLGYCPKAGLLLSQHGYN